MMTWEGLTPPYATIVVDPPWEYLTTAAGWRKGDPRRLLPYSTLTLKEIHALPVEQLAGAGAHLYLWTTNQHLPDAFEVVAHWGFTYSTTLVWCKPSRGLGPHGRFTVTTEFVLHAQAPTTAPPRRIARAGAVIKAAREAAGLTRAELFHRVRGGKKTGLVSNWESDICLPNEADWRRLQQVLPAMAGVPRPEVPPPPPQEPREIARVETTWWQWSRGVHSEKPPAFLDVVEQVSPGPYVELFARQPRLGWDSWGRGYEHAV